MTARKDDARHSIDFVAALSFQRASRFLLMLCLVAQAGAGLVSAEEGSDRYVISEGTLWRSDTGVNEAIEGEFEWRTGPLDPLSGVWPIYPRLLAAGSGRPLPEELVFLDWRLEAGDVSVSQLEVAPGARFPRRTFVNAPHFEFNESGDRIQSFSLTGAQRIDDASDTPTYRFYTWSGEGLVGNPEWNADGTPRLPDEMVLEGTLTTYEETYLLSDPSDDDLCRRILSPFLDVEHEPSSGGIVGREPSGPRNADYQLGSNPFLLETSNPAPPSGAGTGLNRGGSSHLYQLGNGPNPFLLETSNPAPPSGAGTGLNPGSRTLNWLGNGPKRFRPETSNQPQRLGAGMGLNAHDTSHLYQLGSRVLFLDSRAPESNTGASFNRMQLLVTYSDEFEDGRISIRESVNRESDRLEAPILADFEVITRADELLPPIDDPGCRDQVVVGPLEEVGDFSFVLTRQHSVGVEVWPGRPNRRVRPRRDRSMTVAIWGSADLDVRDVDLRSLRLGPDEARPRGLRWTRRFRRRGRDLNGDGYPDLRLRFNPRRSGLQATTTEVCLTGRLHDGALLEGCDRSVRIVDDRKRRVRRRHWRY